MNGIQALDAVVLIVLAVSGVFAFMRGFVHELLSLGGWAGAIFTAMYGLPHLRPIARDWISLSWLADLAAGGALFLAALVLFSMITHAISRRVRDSNLGLLDRTLGFGFGLLRGAVIVCLAWLVLGWLVVIDDQPSWIREAKTRPLLKMGAEILVSLVPSGLDEAEKNAKAAAAKAQEAAESKEMLDQLLKPGPNAPPERAKGGYDAKDRSELDRLIKSKQ